MFCSQARTGGIVMVSFYPHFISCGEKSTLEDVAGKNCSILIINTFAFARNLISEHVTTDITVGLR